MTRLPPSKHYPVAEACATRVLTRAPFTLAGSNWAVLQVRVYPSTREALFASASSLFPIECRQFFPHRDTSDNPAAVGSLLRGAGRDSRICAGDLALAARTYGHRPYIRRCTIRPIHLSSCIERPRARCRIYCKFPERSSRNSREARSFSGWLAASLSPFAPQRASQRTVVWSDRHGFCGNEVGSLQTTSVHYPRPNCASRRVQPLCSQQFSPRPW
jgi:hypothetical protein